MGVMKRLAMHRTLTREPKKVRDGFYVDFDMFFDRKGVGERLLDKERKILSATGAWTRTTMMRSMRNYSQREAQTKRELRKAGRHATARRIGAGKPPRARTKDLKHRIFFGFDGGGFGDDKSVLVGPDRFGSSGGSLGVPRLLHEGGRVSVPAIGGGRGSALYLPRPYASGSINEEKGFDFMMKKTKEIPL